MSDSTDLANKPVRFTHLHVHTEKSLADAMLNENDLAKAIKSMGMNAVAITDHGNMFNVIKFYKACKREGIKPVIGMEAYVAPRSNLLKQYKLDDANYHLVLLAETNEGYQNLMSIASDASVNGMYFKPRTDKAKLREWHSGIIALSACLGGEVQEYLMQKDYDKAKETACLYDEIFGRGNFFLELQDHGMPEQKFVNEALIIIHNETGIPLVCTNDCHYLSKEDYEAHDLLMAIQAKTTVASDKRKKYPSDQFYVKSQEEMEALFNYIPEALENTVKIAERCHVEIDFKSNKLPPFHAPKSFQGTNLDYLNMLTEKGLKDLYGEISQEIAERAAYETSVVDHMGYVNYFLIVWDFFRFCIEGTDEPGMPSPPGWVPILTGPGRGSGAGSILLYALGVTKIDPLKYNLLFERFLDPSRISMPDLFISRTVWKHTVLSLVNPIIQGCAA
jgi:DNA polymerase-3 subunit alpha